MTATKLRVNMVSESDVSVQGHGVHTAYVEIASALESRGDVEVIRGDFKRQTACDIVHFHTIGTRTWRKLFQPGVPKVVSAHVVPASFIGSIILAKYWLFAAKVYMGWYYRRADRVLAVSSTVAGILEHELKVPARKIETFYNSIDMTRYTTSPIARRRARKQLNVREAEYVVLGNGQVQPRKRLDVFVSMARALPRATFIWVGGIPFEQLGADYKSMQRLMDTVPENLTITGVVPHAEVKAYYQAADVFCLPAEQENHPMCVLEAASAGLPIVLRDLREYDDTFADDVWRCRTDAEFVDAIKTLQQKKQREAWTQKTAAIRQRFDSKAAADRLCNLYRQLLDAK